MSTRRPRLDYEDVCDGDHRVGGVYPGIDGEPVPVCAHEPAGRCPLPPLGAHTDPNAAKAALLRHHRLLHAAPARGRVA